MMERTLSDSAFLVNESRARAEELSKDPFAKLWVDDRVRALWQLYNDEIYPFGPIQLGVRNRFFLRQAEEFFQTHANPVFINIAAGFSSYPLLFAQAIDSIEIDLPGVVAFKTAKLEEFRTQGLVPKRDVTYCATDLNDPQDRHALARLLASRCRGRSSFVLVEGLTYYLPPTTFAALMDMARHFQDSGSRLAMDFWLPEVQDNAVFQRFCEFLDRRCGHPRGNYNLLTPSVFEDLPGYQPLIRTDVLEQERALVNEPQLPCWDQVLPENFVVLERR